jgi:hypothetical protein
VVEIISIAVNSIVACYAVRAEIKRMSRHKGGIYLVMAGGAGILIETGVVNLFMAIVTTD